MSDNNYKNPIIFADYSDPDVIRVGSDFYMTASSFNCFPALPILHSKDLVHWKIINHAINTFPDSDFDVPQHGNGIWAPSLRYHNNEFWIFYGDPDRGIFMVKTKDILGKWERPVLVKKAYGNIDPCPLWDDDGKVYLVHAFAHSRIGVKSILQVNELSSDGTKILDKGTIVFDGHKDQPTIEGPKLYKRNGYYYIFAPAGGVKTGWQTVLRSKNIYGPYEDKIVLEQGSTNINGPHQGAWVELASDESWFIHFQDRGAYGRIVHLQPLQWQDDWPLIGVDQDGNGIGEPVAVYKNPGVEKIFPGMKVQTTDDFNSGKLGLQWQWQANFKHQWYSFTANKGSLRLYAINENTGFKNFWTTPNIIAQKFPAEKFDVIAKISFQPELHDDRAGLIIFGNDYAALVMSPKDDEYVLSQIVCVNAPNGENEKIIASTILATPGVYLKASIRENGICVFSYSIDGSAFVSIGREFTATPGKWIGAKIGLFATTSPQRKSGGYADFDFFNVMVH